MREIIRRIKAAWAALCGEARAVEIKEFHIGRLAPFADVVKPHLDALAGEIRTEFAAEIGKLKRAIARKANR